MRVPLVVFILDKFQQVDFREAKEYLYNLFYLLQDNISIRIIAKHKIDFHSVLDAIHFNLKSLKGIEEEFISKDFIRRSEYTKKKIDKKIKKYAEQETQTSITR
ncbi:hypothetical protein WH06_22145 [Aeromonas salmonicida subsp. salmonicida]|uniref:hypothetical protein n=1 Tax=Aeromonas salmonicida TaxID=645 RepID=UPI0005B7FD78|nr:hypothetical protein [Aeromonas salmonicida]EKP0254125.1 hypothetical protein [Aeromonas salmonicida]EKP0266914.1 hypothetical protein [Aeromonas salmonicida]EKP0271155.1 hypothetical protein [Aeromonas salmonicida]EKP0288789.1 hypothetical protein [Aeromonas salmonicida]EKP0293019.1 hypothetical protein [Aeromonas salmonicida]